MQATAHAPEIRERFGTFLKANIALIVVLILGGFFAEFRISRSVALYIGVPTIPLLYLWCCAAYGKLASCFGQSSWSFSVAAFFLYPYEMLLGYFAFNRGVREALDNEQGVSP